MTGLAATPGPALDLPSLIDRATRMLAGAKTAAEVLEAREAAGLAYDVARRAARLSRAKAGHRDPGDAFLAELETLLEIRSANQGAHGARTGAQAVRMDAAAALMGHAEA